MPGAGRRLARWRGGVIPLIVLLVVTADQLTKEWVWEWVRLPDRLSTIFEWEFFRIQVVHNTGAAFGILPGQSLALKIVAIIGILALIAIIVLASRRFPYLISRGTTIGVSLLLGGAIGNLIDRIFRGEVTDFISIGIWPAFNVADSAIVIGAIITALSLLMLTRTKQSRAGDAASGPPPGDDASEIPPPVDGEDGQSPGTAGVG